MKTTIRLQDIAESLNLSISTVSKSLNNSPEISIKTKKRVQELAELKQYLPNTSAQNLKGQKTRKIGVVLPNVNYRFYTDSLKAIEAKANERDYQIILCISNESIEKEIECINKLIRAQVDGIIISPSIETFHRKKFCHLSKLQQYKIPLVIFDRLPQEIKCDKIGLDQNLMVEEATLKLFSQGYKKIGFLAVKADDGKLSYRKNGYFEAISSKALPNLYREFERAELIIRESAMLYTAKKIDAVIVTDEEIAMGIQNVLNKEEYQYSPNLAITCISQDGRKENKVSDIDYIYQNGGDQGRLSADAIIDRIEEIIVAEPIEFILRAEALTNSLKQNL